MIYKILKYFGYISNDDMTTIIIETCKTLEKDFKQEKDRLINLLKDKDSKIDSLESDLKACINHRNELIDNKCEYYNIIEDLRKSNNRFNSRSTSAIKSRDAWKDKYNKLVGKLALKNATHK